MLSVARAVCSHHLARPRVQLCCSGMRRTERDSRKCKRGEGYALGRTKGSMERMGVKYGGVNLETRRVREPRRLRRPCRQPEITSDSPQHPTRKEMRCEAADASG